MILTRSVRRAVNRQVPFRFLHSPLEKRVRHTLPTPAAFTGMNGHLNKILTIESRESGFAERDRNQRFRASLLSLSFVALAEDKPLSEPSVKGEEYDLRRWHAVLLRFKTYVRVSFPRVFIQNISIISRFLCELNETIVFEAGIFF